MKKQNLILTLSVFVSLSSLAQSDASAMQPDARWEIGIKYNSVEAQMNQYLLDSWTVASLNHYGHIGNKNDRSYSVSVFGQYNLTSRMSLNCELGYTAIELNQYYNGIADTMSQNQGSLFGSNLTEVEIIEQNIYRITPTITSPILLERKFQAYFGIGVPINIYGKMHWRDSIVQNDEPTRSNIYISTTEGGFAIGISTVAGIKLNITRWLSLGAGFSAGLSYYHVGGIQSGVLRSHYTNSPDTEYTWVLHDNLSSGVQFVKIIPSLQLSIML